MAKKLSPLLAARVHFGLLRADSPLPLAPIPRRTSPPPATVVHHWPLPLPRNELRAPKRMKPCPHPISTTLLFSSLSFCLRSKIRTLVRKDDRAISIFLASTTRNDRFRPFSFFSAREFFPRKGRRVGNRRNRKEWRERKGVYATSLHPSLSRNRYADGDHGEKGVGRAAVESHEEWRHSITTGKTTAWEPAVPKQCETNGLRGRILVFRFLRSTPIDD